MFIIKIIWLELEKQKKKPQVLVSEKRIFVIDAMSVSKRW